MILDDYKPTFTSIEDFLSNTQSEFETAVLPIPLGVTKEGKYMLGDLEKLGHLLIAGTTGSGKSNFNHAIIYTLIQKYSSRELQFFLADPKIVELVGYQDLAYLYSEIETQPEKIFIGLEKIIEEKNKRQRENKKTAFLVIIIDTFSDLMMSDSSRFEKIVQELTSGTSNTGIHLVMCDSRLSTDVFTDKIKQCFPTKIAFNTVNDEDSEVIIGEMGAEWLLGKGDLFLLEERSNEPLRLQNPLVSDKTISRTVNSHRGTKIS